jgi:hypothetical protein
VVSQNFEDLCRIIGRTELFWWFFVFLTQTPQLLDQGRLTMNLKLLLKVFPVVLLMVVQVVGMGGVARSEVIPLPPVDPVSPLPPVDQSQSIDQLIQQLRTGDYTARSSAAQALSKIGDVRLFPKADKQVFWSPRNSMAVPNVSF